jgi:hypothetical protein
VVFQGDRSCAITMPPSIRQSARPPPSSAMHSCACYSRIRPSRKLTSRRQRARIGLPVIHVTTNNAIRQEMEGLCHLVTGLTRLDEGASHRALQKLTELFRSQPCGTKNGPQGAAIERMVIRHYHLAERVIAAYDDVASHLPDDAEAGPPQDPQAISARDNRKVGHTVTRRASKCSSGTGRLSASKAPT